MMNDNLVERLGAMADVLDIRAVLPHVSEIAKHLLPHDHLHLLFIDPATGHATSQSGSTDAFPDLPRATLDRRTNVQIVSDLRAHRSAATLGDRRDPDEALAAAGYRSLLAVRRASSQEELRVEFYARRPEAYSPNDVPAARRIAEYIAGAVSAEAPANPTPVGAQVERRPSAAEVRAQSLAASINRQVGRAVIMGDSPRWRDALGKASQVAATQATVFLQGESGTGKEVLARFIHRGSPRKDGPFVAINCAALPETLLESELFGYERGAFTGAHQSKPGQVELASGGVLFLDEVSEMSPAAQAKFLRVLQEREFQRLGGTRPIKTNVRVIAASNRNLAEAVSCGAFREDLYYRLQVFDIHIPPLRERASDIPLLTDAFLEDIGRSMECPVAGVSDEARRALLE